ncbi:hypothetical protein XAP6164_3260015 [Xanthomonas phaseoli pv. phaseoli]|nr:hypothetical protein XAP6164_3260015 [Xanthomonas phaseoli pv. phaseoli]
MSPMPCGIRRRRHDGRGVGCQPGEGKRSLGLRRARRGHMSTHAATACGHGANNKPAPITRGKE